MRECVPVIDLFAGPGGLAEGFASFVADGRKRPTFKIGISVEKDEFAHKTLELRSFYRQFINQNIPEEYYRYLKGECSREQLFNVFPAAARAAKTEARLAELGTADDSRIYNWIEDALQKYQSNYWVLIGGPPCQAYSTAGRSRRRADPRFETDKKHFLYREYLQILARFHPSIFIMENVKGILSSRVNGENIFDRIMADLKDPTAAIKDTVIKDSVDSCEEKPLTYRIYSLVISRGEPEKLRPTDFIIKSEEYGIPQTRHRVVLLGVRSDLNEVPRTLTRSSKPITASSVLDDLPSLRSSLSRNPKNAGRKDSEANWRSVIEEVLTSAWFNDMNLKDNDLFSGQLQCAISKAIRNLRAGLGTGEVFIPGTVSTRYNTEWYNDHSLRGICNHISRGHMGTDLHRYLFAACYAQVYGRSPRVHDYPKALLPEHKNLQKNRRKGDEDFNDRFRVQIAESPATTITSHISKDGHYNIHYDPTQCRSLTVREAARLQTFKDNYFFEGPRTQQYLQVGNAVPPLLAYKIAGVVHDLLEKIHATRQSKHTHLSENIT